MWNSWTFITNKFPNKITKTARMCDACRNVTIHSTHEYCDQWMLLSFTVCIETFSNFHSQLNICMHFNTSAICEQSTEIIMWTIFGKIRIVRVQCALRSHGATKNQWSIWTHTVGIVTILDCIASYGTIPTYSIHIYKMCAVWIYNGFCGRWRWSVFFLLPFCRSFVLGISFWMHIV